jgi:hypothetical protein
VNHVKGNTRDVPWPVPSRHLLNAGKDAKAGLPNPQKVSLCSTKQPQAAWHFFHLQKFLTWFHILNRPHNRNLQGYTSYQPVPRFDYFFFLLRIKCLFLYTPTRYNPYQHQKESRDSKPYPGFKQPQAITNHNQTPKYQKVPNIK